MEDVIIAISHIVLIVIFMVIQQSQFAIDVILIIIYEVKIVSNVVIIRFMEAIADNAQMIQPIMIIYFVIAIIHIIIQM